LKPFLFSVFRFELLSWCTARLRLLNVGSSGLRGWCLHRSPQLGLRLTATLAWPLACCQQSCRAGFCARAHPLPHSKPAKPPLWCNRSVAIIPFLRHPLSSGF
jgi:hypothetical protein